MFRNHCVILRYLAFITLPSYISTIAVLVKINKIFKNIKLSMIKRLLLQFLWSLCGGRIYNLCVDVIIVLARYVLPEDDIIVSKHVGAW
jgi:hypothetical protein